MRHGGAIDQIDCAGREKIPLEVANRERVGMAGLFDGEVGGIRSRIYLDRLESERVDWQGETLPGPVRSEGGEGYPSGWRHLQTLVRMRPRNIERIEKMRRKIVDKSLAGHFWDEARKPVRGRGMVGSIGA